MAAVHVFFICSCKQTYGKTGNYKVHCFFFSFWWWTPLEPIPSGERQGNPGQVATSSQGWHVSCVNVKLSFFPHFLYFFLTKKLRKEGWTRIRCSMDTRSMQDFPQIKYVNRSKTIHCRPLPGAPEMELNCLNQLEFTLPAAAAALFGLGSCQCTFCLF